MVRAFDQAGNYLQKTQRLQIITHIFDIVLNQGIKVRSNVIISWMWVYIIIFILIIILGYLVRVFWTRHRMAHERLESGELPDSVRRQLEELKTLKEKYQKTAFVLLLGIVGLASLFLGPTARAETVELSPPIIDVVARNISNQDIFYISGSTEAAGSVVVVYLQNLQTGETGSHNVEVDKNGKWFYTHSSFLSGGNYMVWVQNKVGPVESPPSPQVELTVSPTALQLGSSRLSYAFVFLVIAIILFIILIILFGAMVYHYRTGKKKHAKFVEETRHAEELVRRGFALLHRDIQSEFKLLEQSKASRGLTEEEEELEQKIFRDLQTVKNYVGKELWEIEQKL